MIRLWPEKGPRSLTRTMIRFPLSSAVTSTYVGNGSVVCAAVIHFA